MQKSVFTIAVGKPLYFDMACALARSFLRWHAKSEIRFFLATDRNSDCLPEDLKDIGLISISQEEFGEGFTPKLFLDRIAPTERSLFIDADCLCVGSLDHAFLRFQGHAVSVIGREISDGEWFGDVGAICRKFRIRGIPRFNGGVYYLEKGEECSRVYDTARELLPQYDELGFVRLRNHPNDEVLVSLAMAIHGQRAIPECGDIMNSLLAGVGGITVDVLKGSALLRNPKNHPNHNAWYEREEHRPRIVHFLGTPVNSFPYNREIERLELVYDRGWPTWLAKSVTSLQFSLPYYLINRTKTLLRPMYHALFGPRAIRHNTHGRFE